MEAAGVRGYKSNVPMHACTQPRFKVLQKKEGIIQLLITIGRLRLPPAAAELDTTQDSRSCEKTCIALQGGLATKKIKDQGQNLATKNIYCSHSI